MPVCLDGVVGIDEQEALLSFDDQFHALRRAARADLAHQELELRDG